MPTTRFVPPEGSRYGASLVFLPGLWAGPETWQPASSYLAHRGWEGRILDLRDVSGGLGARVASAANAIASLPAPPAVLGHDAGALVALGLASRVPVRAVVLVSPIVPGSPGTHALLWSARLVWRLLVRGRVGAPSGGVARRVFDELPERLRASLSEDDPKLVVDLLRGRVPPAPPPGGARLVVRGAADPVLSHEEAGAFADRAGATLDEVDGAGHWPLAGPAWRTGAERVHRWLVRTLDEPLLDLYAEAMAERGDDGEEPS